MPGTAVRAIAVSGLVVYGVVVAVFSMAALPGGFFLPSLWIRLAWISDGVRVSMILLLIVSWMALGALLIKRLRAASFDPAPGSFQRLSALRVSLVGFLIAGTGASVYSDALFRAFVNTTDFCCMRPVDAADIFFASLPFILAGLPLLVRSWAIAITVLVAALAAGLLTLPAFFIGDPQHGTDGLVGSWLFQMVAAGICLLVCAVIVVIGILFADD